MNVEAGPPCKSVVLTTLMQPSLTVPMPGREAALKVIDADRSKHFSSSGGSLACAWSNDEDLQKLAHPRPDQGAILELLRHSTQVVGN